MSNHIIGVPITSSGVGSYPALIAPRTTSASVSTTSDTSVAIGTQTTSASGDLKVGAVCYSTCNNAYKLAISIGDVGELCDPNGDFLAGITACAKCIEENTQDSNRELPDELRQISDICAGGLVFTTDTFLMADGKTSTITHLVNVSSTSTTSWTTLQSASSTSAPAVTSSAAVSGPESNAWIAGPVIGGVAGLSIAIFAALWLWRRRSRRTTPVPEDGEHYEKAQLHSDCVPKPVHEAADGAVHEMQGSSPQKVAAEKAANEPPCYELPASDTKPQHNDPSHNVHGV